MKTKIENGFDRRNSFKKVKEHRMKQKNSLFFCLLMSTMLLFSFSSLFAAVTVTYQNNAFPYNTTGNVITAQVNATEPIAAFDLLTNVRTTITNAFGTITAVNVAAVAGAVANTSKVDGTSEDSTRIYGFGCATPIIMPAGIYNFTFTVTTSCDTGQFVFEDGGQWLVDPDPVNAYSQFVNASAANATLTVNNGTYRVFNQAPVITNCPGSALMFNACDIVTYNFDFTDASIQCLPAPDETWNVISGPGSIDNSGNFVWDPPAVAGVCGLYEIKVTVTDEYGGKDTCQFEVSLTSDAPVYTECPTPGSELFVYWGWTADGDVTAVDPDNCPVALSYSLNNFTGPVTAGPFTVNPATGEWSWPTQFGNDAYLGDWTATIDVTDGCNTVSCSFTIHVAPNFQVLIEKTHNTIQGHFEYVSIKLLHWTEGFGGYDLLIAYDNSALSLISAAPGNILTACGFEYFTYRFGANGNCSGGCPSGLVRVVAIADINNGANHPSCYGEGRPGPEGPEDELVILKFLVTDDRTFECMFVPISFFWIDCGDNTFSSITGDTLFLSNHVYGYGDPFFEITGQLHYGGWQGIDEPDPLVCLEGDKYHPDTIVDFYDGGIDIICADSIDDRGDINLNGIANEIADAVLYSNYFLYGVGALDPVYYNAQVAASDVNADGVPLTVGDLVYLLRIIVGDALPFAKLTPFSATANLNVVNGMVSTESSENIGALYLIFDVTGEANVVSHTDMEVQSNVREGQLHVLIWSGMENMTNSIPAGTNDLVTVTGAELTSVQVADFYGSMMQTSVAKTALPTEFALAQNTPNPFNPLTKIGLDLPVLTDWKVDIYNVSGQLVKSYNGTNIGHVEVIWDAKNAPSGVYFYKASAGSFNETKKMVLMK
jgi:hypothetical protein